MAQYGRIDAISGNNSRAQRTNKYKEYLNNFNNILHGTNANTSKGATGPSLFGHGFADVSASSSTTCAGNRNN